MTLRSAAFDDIYFSPEDGLAETRHVFLDNNNLPAAWVGRPRFTVAETGFGTGLNFLAAWTLFEETAGSGQRLDFISFEKYPLAREEGLAALVRWRDVFGGRLERLRAVYPLRVPGFHRLHLTDRVGLTLIFDDVNDALPQLEVPGGVDAWFLDGFAPAKNPDMWTDTLFTGMARLSRPGTSFATFTAAGAVKRGLEAAGFAVEKRRGYGRKRDMLAGCFQGEVQRAAVLPLNGPVAIIGAGLAGAAVAYALRRAGAEPVIFDAGGQIASGASGNPSGLFNPRLSAQRTADSDFYTAGWASAVRTLAEIQARTDIGLEACGSLHLATDEDKGKKLHGAAARWGWHADHMTFCDAGDAATRCGLPVTAEGLLLPDAGVVSPARLCAAYADGVEIHLNTPIRNPERGDSGWRINGRPFAAVIFACGVAVTEFAGLEWLPVHTVRGQMTMIETNSSLRGLRTNLCFGGYLSPPQEGLHALGATFQRGDADGAVRQGDHQDNIARLAAILPGLETPRIVGGRASFRTSSHDRLPLIGMLPDRAAWESGEEKTIPGLYVSTGHGSHGIVSSLAAAELLADIITGAPRSLSRASSTCVDPARFLRRARRRGTL